MPTRFIRLTDNERTELQDGPAYKYWFASSERPSAIFAIACHRHLGWPIVALFRDKEGDVIEHFLVQEPQDTYTLRDARGPMTNMDMVADTLSVTMPPTLRPITEAEILERWPDITDREVEQASTVAYCLWPDLPWEDTAIKRMVAFLDEFEALSRRHGYTLFATTATTWPAITNTGDDFDGYDIRIGDIPGHFFFNRRLVRPTP